MTKPDSNMQSLCIYAVLAMIMIGLHCSQTPLADQEGMASRVQRAGLLLETPGHVNDGELIHCASFGRDTSKPLYKVCPQAQAAKLIASFLETCCVLSCMMLRDQGFFLLHKKCPATLQLLASCASGESSLGNLHPQQTDRA